MPHLFAVLFPRARTLFLMLLGVLAAGAAWGQEAQPGLQWEAVYTGDVVANLAGGAERGTVYLGNVDLMARLDGGRLVGWPGSTLFLYGLGTHGGKPSRLVGDAQGVNNIEAPSTWKLYETWLQQIVFDHRLSLLAGLYDLNSEFDVMQAASLFLNSSHGIGPDFSQSGKNGPSIFPTTSLGGRARLLVAQDLYFQTALLDGVPGNPDNPRGTHVIFGEQDGWLVASEIGLLIGTADEPDVPLAAQRRRDRQRRLSRLEESTHRAKVAVGAWTYTMLADDLLAAEGDDPPSRSRSSGLYVLTEWNAYQEAEDAEQGLALFARFGVASSRVNRFEGYNGAGVVYTGLVPGRDADQAGLAVAAAHNGGPYKTAQRRAGRAVTASEINLELTYAAILTSRLALQAGAQYVLNPDTDPSRGDALVTFIRFQVSR